MLSFPKNKRAQDRLAALNKSQDPDIIQNPPQEIIDRLINFNNQGHFETMANEAKALTEQYPNAFIIWNCLGVANMNLRRIEQASQAFRKVTELNPNYADGHNNLGVALQEQEKLNEALESYNKVLLLNSNYADAYYNIGKVLYDQGKLDKADRILQKGNQY